jgi:hypothetical protein
MSTSTCSALKTMLADGKAPMWLAPQLRPLHMLAPSLLDLGATEPQAKARCSRQIGTANWVFTPVVCLGPAFQSLAPPLHG